LLISADLLSTV